MSLIEFARDTLEDYRRRLYRTLDGLTIDELNWRPNAEANSIAFVVWHTSRVEDRWFQVFCQGVPDIWVRDEWHRRLGLGETDVGVRYTVEQLGAFPKLTNDDIRGLLRDLGVDVSIGRKTAAALPRRGRIRASPRFPAISGKSAGIRQ